MKWIIPIVLLMIVFSLGSALYYMMKDRGNSSRMVRSLMLRIGLSVALFLGILLAYYFGLIEATGIKVGTNENVIKERVYKKLSGLKAPIFILLTSNKQRCKDQARLRQQSANTKLRPQKQSDA